MGEVLVAIIGLVGTLSAGVVLSHPSAMHSLLSWRALFSGLLAAWLISKGLAASLGLVWFPESFAQGTTVASVIVSLRVWEALMLVVIVMTVAIRHGRNNPAERDPFADIKKREADRQRWMKDMGE